MEDTPIPIHDFIGENGEIITVYVPIGEPATSHQAQVVDGRTFKRLWEAPHAAVNTAVGDMTKDDFRRVTEGKNVSVGDMFDISKEMSQARASREGGQDPVKLDYYRDWAKKMGYPHPDIGKQAQRDALRKATGIILSD